MSLQPNVDIQNIAAAYCRDNLMPPPKEGHYVRVNPERATIIASFYDVLEVDRSYDPVVRGAYKELELELFHQWYAITDRGYVLEAWTHDGQPYANSREMRDDVRENKHLYFFTGGEEHPLLNCRWSSTGFTSNEMLRAVHDIFGHATEGYGFGARGEENAWIHHSMMFTKEAQRALTTETRGQNSWVNFGPYSHLPVTERPYADQKVALLPDWCCDWKEALNVRT